MARPFRSHVAELAREPIVHFVLIGAAIWGIHGAVAGTQAADQGARITITAGEIEMLRAGWSTRWRRPPTTEETQTLLDAYLREEVLYREALALGLDRDDAVIRRRMVQKFEFLIEDLTASAEPKESDLLAYFKDNETRYRLPQRISFQQIYFSPDRRGAAAVRDAVALLSSLQSEAASAPVAAAGDASLLENAYGRQTLQEIVAVFGREFAEAVSTLEPGVWAAPIASGYGLHLVRVDERIAGRMPEFAEVEAQVRADWAYDQRRKANEQVFRQLLAGYVVDIADHQGAE